MAGKPTEVQQTLYDLARLERLLDKHGLADAKLRAKIADKKKAAKERGAGNGVDRN